MRRQRCFYLAIGLSVFLASASTVLAEPQIGNVVQKQFNGALGTRAVSAPAEELLYARIVFAGEKVNTPANGSTVMRFADQTQLQIGANSSVVLDRFVYDPGTQTSNGSIKFVKGLFRYIGGQASSESGVQLATPTAVLTIRGTKFLVYVTGDGTTTVGVLDGAVDVNPCDNGNTVHVKIDQAVQVAPNCTTTAVSVTSIPSDPAVDGDYSVTGAPGNGDHEGTNGTGTGTGSAGPSPGGGVHGGPL